MTGMTRSIVALALLSGAGCEVGLPAGSEPHRELNFINMGDQPKYKPQRGDLFGEDPTGMRAPPVGAVATDEEPYPYDQKQGERAGAELENPLRPTPEVMEQGKFIFENVCIVCHGPRAAGDGHLTRLFPKPPSLMTQKVRDWTDGRIFHLPMRGQGSMPSHATQLEPHEIWAVIHYIRALQKAEPVAPPPPGAQSQPARPAPQSQPAPGSPESRPADPSTGGQPR